MNGKLITPPTARPAQVKPGTCGACKFGEKADLTQIVCRGAPPTPVMIGVIDGPMGQKAPNIVTLFPIIEAGTPGCGTYQPRSTLALEQTAGQA